MMSDMLATSVSWTAWAYLTTWWLSLLFAVVASPPALLPILDFIVVTVAMLMISYALFKNRWLWPG
jgi:hypothetical protein